MLPRGLIYRRSAGIGILASRGSQVLFHERAMVTHAELNKKTVVQLTALLKERNAETNG